MSHDPFPTTHWSRVLRAGGRADSAARAALAELCAAYWYPLYAFVRRKGYAVDEAADAVQGTFVNLLDRDALATVAPQRGRFRSFLMASCAHYLADCRDREQAAKRGGGKSPISIDRLSAEERYAAEPTDDMTPERLFERRWAMSILERAVERLEAEGARSGRGDLTRRLIPNLTGGRGAVPLAVLAEELGMTEGAVKMASTRLRKRYGEILRDEIARTVSDAADIETEIRDLFSALAR